MTRATCTKNKNKKRYWTQVHQDAFYFVRHTLAEEIILTCPDYKGVSKIYTDASQRQVGAVITQERGPLAF